MTADAKRTMMKREQMQQKDRLLGGEAMSYLEGIKSEFRKITWTEPEALKTYTKVVVGSTFVFGIGIYVVDLMIQTFLRTLEALVKITVG